MRRAGGRFVTVVAVFACLGSVDARADATEDWHAWGNVTATGRLGDESSRWRGWLEGQGRFDDDMARFNQGIVRAGVGYALRTGLTLWGGYAYVVTDPPDRTEDVVEHRVWQQLLWQPTPFVGRMRFTSRTRLEQRLVEGAADTGWRVRQFVKATRPLMGSERYFVSLWDELFVHLDDTDWGARTGFDQNRLFAGLGVRLTDVLTTEVGYINQYVERAGTSDPLNHILSLNLFVQF